MDLSRITEALPTLARFMPQPSGQAAPEPSTFTPSPARVNLIPPAALAFAAARRGRTIAVGFVAASVLGVAALYGSGLLTQKALQSDIDELNAAKARIDAELAVYAPVTNVAAQTVSLTETIDRQTNDEVLHGEVLSEFVRAAEQVGEIRQISLQTGEGLQACQSVDPFQQRVLVGCLTFTVAVNGGQADAANLISNLSGSPLFVDAFIPSVTSAGGETTLTGTVGVTDAALWLEPSTDALTGVEEPQTSNGENVADPIEGGDA